jgi:hypothetical protein
MAIDLKGLLSKQKQSGGFLSPLEGENFSEKLTDFISRPTTSIGQKILSGEPIVSSILTGTLQAGEIKKSLQDTVGATKQAMDPRTGEVVFATEQEIQALGLVPVEEDPNTYREYTRTTNNPTPDGYAAFLAKKSSTATAEYGPISDADAAQYGISSEDYQVNLNTNKIEKISKEAPALFEGAESEVIGKDFGNRYVQIGNNAAKAYTDLNNLDTLEFLLSEVDPNTTGAFAEFNLETTKILNKLGFDATINENVAQSEAIKVIGGQFVLQGLQSFVGAISDGERKFIESISPGLSLTRDGNLLLLALQKRGANRNLDIEAIRDTFYDSVGSLSGKNKDGKTFNQVLGDFYEENPFMDDDFRTELKEISSKGLNSELLTDGGHCVNGKIHVRIGKGKTSQIIDSGKSC